MYDDCVNLLLTVFWDMETDTTPATVDTDSTTTVQQDTMTGTLDDTIALQFASTADTVDMDEEQALIAVESVLETKTFDSESTSKI